MVRLFVLKLVYDDSDAMSDYYSPDATLFRWPIMEVPGKKVTEKKLWDALGRLPRWIRELGFELERDSYRRLRLRQRGCLGISYPFGYAGTGFEPRPLQFLIEDTGLRFGDDEGAIPQSFEELRRRVEAEVEERRRRMETGRIAAIEAQIRVMESAHAIIGPNGFEILTPEARRREIEKLRERLEELKAGAGARAGAGRGG
jgi:hypothetical protein